MNSCLKAIVGAFLFLLSLGNVASAQQENNYWKQGTANVYQDWQPVSLAAPMPVQVTGGGVPSASAVQITGNAQGTTGAVVGTLASAVGKTTFICGFNVSAVGGTAAVNPVVAGIIGSSQNYQMVSGTTPILLAQTFSPCLPASASNTAITVTTTAAAGATAVDVNTWGYQQ